MDTTEKIENIKRSISSRRFQAIYNRKSKSELAEIKDFIQKNSEENNTHRQAIVKINDSSERGHIPFLEEDKLFQEMLKIYELAEADASVQENLSEFERLPNNTEEDKLFQEILRIYALIDNVAAAIEDKNIVNQDLQFEIAQPFMHRALEFTNELVSLYTDAAKADFSIDSGTQSEFEKTFQAFYEALHEVINAMEAEMMPQEWKENHPPIIPGGEYVKELSSPLAKEFLKRPIRGTQGSRLDRIRIYLNPTSGSLLVFAVDELACHISQLLVEFTEPELGLVRSFDRGYPPKGYASKLARKAAKLSNK